MGFLHSFLTFCCFSKGNRSKPLRKCQNFSGLRPPSGARPSFDLRRAPQAGSGGVEAFLGENCPNPRDLSATSPAPEAFLGVPQHVIFAFQFQNELALFFFWGQNELAQFSSEGGFELALFFFWADFGFFLGPFRASSVSWLYRPRPNASAAAKYGSAMRAGRGH